MRLSLTPVGVAVAAVALSGQPTVSALRSGSEHAVKVMEVSATEAVVCSLGEQKTLAIKAANEIASFKCGTGLVLDPAFKEDAQQAYPSPTAQTAVALTSIVPKAKFTQTSAAASPGGKQGEGSGTGNDPTYHLSAPELPADDKVVVFKCLKEAASAKPNNAGESASRQDNTGASEDCVVTINVAKSAASKELRDPGVALFFQEQPPD